MKKYIILLSVIFFIFSGCEKEEMPVALFDIPSDLVYVGDNIEFTNTSTNGSSYSWQFGDDKESTEKNPVHSYEYSGDFDVVLMAFSSSGNLGDDIKKTINVLVREPIADFTVSSVNVEAGTSIQFTNKSDYYQRSEWQFGNGDQSIIKSPSHVYTKAGTYTATLKVYSQNDQKNDSYSMDIIVSNGEAFYDGFDQHTNFTLDFEHWKNYDVDGLTTYGFSDYDFANEFYTGSFIIFNPSATTPSLAEYFQAYSNSKMAVCFGAVEEGVGAVNNDWLYTSHKIKTGVNYQLSFWAMSFYFAGMLPDYFELGVTTQDYSTLPLSFSIVETVGSPGVPDVWTEYTIDLSNYASQEINIGFHVFSPAESFMFCLDDFFVAEKETSKAVSAKLKEKYAIINKNLKLKKTKPLIICD